MLSFANHKKKNWFVLSYPHPTHTHTHTRKILFLPYLAYFLPQKMFWKKNELPTPLPSHIVGQETANQLFFLSLVLVATYKSMKERSSA